MLYRDVSKLLSFFFFGLSLTLLIPLAIAAYYQLLAPQLHPQPHGTLIFSATFAVAFLLGALFRFLGKEAKGRLYRREGILVVAIIWLLTPAIAGLPYYLSGTLQNPMQAYFEGASGLTTTGATTLTAKKYDPESGKEVPIQYTVPGVHPTTYTFYGTVAPVVDERTKEVLAEGIEAVGKSVLFWRSFTQWLGGMGIIVLFVAVLPALGVGGKQLFHAEMPGPIKESLTPRIKETALQLWKIYMLISTAEVALLMATNHEMTLFDAVTITFSNVSTGGFSVHNTSIGYYNSAATEWVVIAFMFLSSINFSLYFFALRGKLWRFYDSELLLYCVLVAASCGICTYFLTGTEELLLTGAPPTIFTAPDALRYSIFQVVSAQTTTGFTTADYNIWPYTTQVFLIIVMYLGGMAGSTAGGMKTMRQYMLFRVAQYKVESIFRPETVRRFRVGDSDVDTSAIVRVLCYFVILVACAALGTFFFIMDGTDPESAFSLVTCMINNIGIGFRMNGPTQSCAFLSNFGLGLSSFLMIVGRLEFFVILAVLVPAFWRRQ